MMNDAIAFVMKAFSAGVTEFGRILNAIPGSQALIIASFFLTVTVGMIIMPLRGGRFIERGGDLSSETVSDITRTVIDDRGVHTSRSISHGVTRRIPKGK